MSDSPQLRLTRPDLADLPPVALPEACTLHAYRPGDGAHWERIITASFGTEPGRYSFDRTMRRMPPFRPERIFFIDVDGVPAATASAWEEFGFRPETGTIHYVGVDPAYQGRRLGFWVTLAAMHHMREEGCRAVTLTTDDFRLAAIKTYLRLGFEPVLVHENQRDRWRAVFEHLHQPEWIETFARVLNGPLFRPASFAEDDFDYAGLCVQRYRHHPDRPPARPTFGECDALADEHLYRASRLGRAGIVPDRVTAGENQPFELWFEAGPEGLPGGTLVHVHVMGQRPLGDHPQTHNPAAPAHVEVVPAAAGRIRLLGGPQGNPSSSNTDLSPLPRRTMMGFVVAEEGLRPGERVFLHVGRQAGFHWTPLAGRKEFKIIIDPGKGEPAMRLPEPVVMTILPGPPATLHLRQPGSAAAGKPVYARLFLRDRFGNRVPEDSTLTLSGPTGKPSVRLDQGYGRFFIGTMGKSPLRSRAASPGVPATAVGVTLPVDDDGLSLYFGDLHAHDFTCAAEAFTGEVYRWARDEQALDFLSVPPQCHAWLDNERWTLAKHFAEAYLEEGRFVTFPAFEWQHSHYGDKVIHYLSGDQPYLPVDDRRYAHPTGLYAALGASDALVISHHSGYALDLHVPGTDWQAVNPDIERLTELWSMHGSSEGYDPADRPLVPPRREDGVMAALRQGLRLGFTAGSDTHSGRPGGSAKEPRPYWGGICGVWAKALTRRALFEALYARRTVALTGERIALRFDVDGAPMGSEIPFREKRRLRVRVWAPHAVRRVDILRDTKLWHRETPDADQVSLSLEDQTTESSLYHVRVTLEDDSLAVCSPVWVG